MLNTVHKNILGGLIASLSILGIGVVGSGCQDNQIVRGYPDQYSGIGVELKIDEPTQEPPVGEIVFKIRGKAGSQLSLKLNRAGRTIWSVMPRGSLKRVDEDYKLSTGQ